MNWLGIPKLPPPALPNEPEPGYGSLRLVSETNGVGEVRWVIQEFTGRWGGGWRVKAETVPNPNFDPKLSGLASDNSPFVYSDTKSIFETFDEANERFEALCLERKRRNWATDKVVREACP